MTELSRLVLHEQPNDITLPEAIVHCGESKQPLSTWCESGSGGMAVGCADVLPSGAASGKWRVEKWLQALLTVPPPVVYKDGETDVPLVL